MANTRALRIRFYVSDSFLDKFNPILGVSTNRGVKARELLSRWDGKRRNTPAHWRGEREFRLTRDEWLDTLLAQASKRGLAREEVFFGAFAQALEEGEKSQSDKSASTALRAMVRGRAEVAPAQAQRPAEVPELSEAQIQHLQKVIEGMVAETKARVVRLGMRSESLREGDEADQAAGQSDEEDRRLLLAHANKRLRELEAALQRIKDGEYGYCEETGEPIGWERLCANPIARYTVEAQDRLERASRLRTA